MDLAGLWKIFDALKASCLGVEAKKGRWTALEPPVILLENTTLESDQVFSLGFDISLTV